MKEPSVCLVLCLEEYLPTEKGYMNVFDGTKHLLFAFLLVHWAFSMFLLSQIFHTVNNWC